MKPSRLLELLAYAKVCFDHCTTPFESTHLQKQNVKADECRDLSFKIAETVFEYIEWNFKEDEVEKAMEQARKQFEETQTSSS